MFNLCLKFCNLFSIKKLIFLITFLWKTTEFFILTRLTCDIILNTNLIISISRYNEESQRCRRCIGSMMKQLDEWLTRKTSTALFNLTFFLVLFACCAWWQTWLFSQIKVDWKLIPCGCLYRRMWRNDIQ